MVPCVFRTGICSTAEALLRPLDCRVGYPRRDWAALVANERSGGHLVPSTMLQVVEWIAAFGWGVKTSPVSDPDKDEIRPSRHNDTKKHIDTQPRTHAMPPVFFSGVFSSPFNSMQLQK
jgi:hypothetical protein